MDETSTGSTRPTFRERVRLKDGTAVNLRPVQPEDAEALRSLFHRLSPESIYYRFLEARKDLPLEQARNFAHVDYTSTMAIVAEPETHSQEAPILGVARYGLSEGSHGGYAEAAIVVEDAHQGKGLGTALLLQLVEYARSVGIRGFHATIHQSNARILSFIKKSGLPSKRQLEGGVWEISVELPPLSQEDADGS